MRCQDRFVFRALLVLGLSSALLSGCGGSEKGLVSVAGKVTLDGGAWPKAGKITFTPSAKGASAQGDMRPASADFDTSGRFTVNSYEGTPGLYPGEYSAALECWDVLPGMADPSAASAAAKKGRMPGPGKSYVPQKYQSPATSGFNVTVEAGKSVSVNFDAKSK